MNSMVDTFVEYLASQLSGKVDVFYMRASADDPQSHRLRDDALNVSVLATQKEGRLRGVLVSLDLVGDDQRTVFGWQLEVEDVLCAYQFTPELQYVPDPDDPVPSGQSIYWDGDIGFDVVVSQHSYVHLSSNFTIWCAR